MKTFASSVVGQLIVTGFVSHKFSHPVPVKLRGLRSKGPGFTSAVSPVDLFPGRHLDNIIAASSKMSLHIKALIRL